MSKLSIILPVYENADTLDAVYDELRKEVLSRLDDYEIVMVDDGSTDDSWSCMNRLAADDHRVVALKLSRNFGSHAAILAGLSVCTGDCAVIKSADGQEPSALLLQLLQSWEQGYKVVLAVRAGRQENVMRRASAGLYYRLVRRCAAPTMPKTGFDCYLIDRQVIDVLKLLDENNAALTLQILWSGFRTATVPYVRQKRQQGRSRWTLAKKSKLLLDSLIGFSCVPIRLTEAVGALLFAGAAVWGLILLGRLLFGGIAASGFTVLAMLVLLSCGLVLLALGLLGEYVWRGMEAARRRPAFLIEEQKGGTQNEK